MKKVVFLTGFDFDDKTGAAYNRVRFYIKALNRENIGCILTSTLYINVREESKGNLLSMFIGAKRFQKSLFRDFYFWRYFKYLKEINQKDSVKNVQTFVLYNSDLASVLITYLYLILILRKKCFIEKNESQMAMALNLEVSTNSFVKLVFFNIYRVLKIIIGLIVDLVALLHTGIISISMTSYYIYSRFKKRIINIPILVDNIMQSEVKHEKTSFKIGYFGHLGEKKDGVLSMIESINKLRVENRENVSLHLYGKMANSTKPLFENIFENHSNIIYHGVIESSKVQLEMRKYDLLISLRPRNMQTQFGFSTKLGEYLITGVPVLVSNVSDISLYLKDNVSAFILPSKKKIDKNELFSKLELIIEIDNAKLKEIGNAGQKVAEKHFNYRVYSKKLSSFLTNE